MCIVQRRDSRSRSRSLSLRHPSPRGHVRGISGNRGGNGRVGGRDVVSRRRGRVCNTTRRSSGGGFGGGRGLGTGGDALEVLLRRACNCVEPV